MGRQKKTELSGVKEIARRANVSIATVDRVIHNRKGVSEATRQKISEIIAEMGFQPNILASRLASKKVNHFAVLIPKSSETDYWESPVKGIERAHQEIKQYGIVLDKYFYDLNDKKSFTKAANLLLQKQCDGVLVAPSFIREATDFTSYCQAKNIPYVFINSDIPGRDSLCYIGPHLYKSGYQAGQLISFGLKAGNVLIVNISREIDSYHHLLRKEDGFRAYFNDNKGGQIELAKIDIRDTDQQSIEETLDAIIAELQGVDALFVTNSRVRSVASYLVKRKLEHKILIGYDFLQENVKYLKQGVIDFLIGQKPEEQGYLGLMTLFQHIVMGGEMAQVNYMPIDIITKENYEFYKN
ncbi:LacI family transcriptional regulator [Parapedobacter composti]|uniref:LacI family transcriptional regulator n=1 Tax=Parapedobacter composti TaxID=623281 RepID=A0A1I1E649_9SPHI|nr:substrate-binding domain-containing protein [Parapedobacter composti]SFB82126.1 LacI family transcriptional regulator [Parapedobacter composti]